MGYKYNQKSVRLSDEVLNFINSYPDGQNFNQKLENIILFVFKNEKEMTRRLDSLHKDIDIEKHKLIEIRNEIYEFNDIKKRFESLINTMDNIIEEVH